MYQIYPGTIPGMEEVESSQDAYMDVGGSECLEHILESESGRI